MGCGASHGLHAYAAAAEPKVRQPLSEEELKLLQAKVVRQMTRRMQSAAWRSWLDFYKARKAQQAKERAARKVLSKLRNLPFVQCKAPHLLHGLLALPRLRQLNPASAACGAQPSSTGFGG